MWSSLAWYIGQVYVYYASESVVQQNYICLNNFIFQIGGGWFGPWGLKVNTDLWSDENMQ